MGGANRDFVSMEKDTLRRALEEATKDARVLLRDAEIEADIRRAIDEIENEIEKLRERRRR